MLSFQLWQPPGPKIPEMMREIFWKWKTIIPVKHHRLLYVFSHSDILLTLIFVDINFCWKDMYLHWVCAQRSFPQSPDSRLNSKHLNKSQRPALQGWSDPIIQHTNWKIGKRGESWIIMIKSSKKSSFIKLPGQVDCFFVSNKKMIPTSTSLVPHRPLSCESGKCPRNWSLKAPASAS